MNVPYSRPGRIACVLALWFVIGACGARAAGGGTDAGRPATARSGASGNAPVQAPKASGPKCGATPVQLVNIRELAAKIAAGARSASSLAVDANNVYFVFNNSLMSVPIRGGSIITMFPLTTVPHLTLQDVDLIVTSSVILHYVTTDGRNEQIASVSINGGKVAMLALSSGGIDGIAADEQNVYFVDQAGVKSVAASGGSTRILTDQVTSSEPGGIFGNTLAVVGSNVIVTVGRDGGSVLSVPIRGGAPTTLATGQNYVSFPLRCGADTCWWAGAAPAGNAGTSGPGAIVRMDATGTLTTLPQAPFFPWSLAFDGEDFFETVGCDICDGTLLRIPSAGGSAVHMGPGAYVAVDDRCAYWSTSDGISSVIKSYGGT